MSPEFTAVLEQRETLGLWFILLPVALGFLSLLVSAVKTRKAIALINVTLLALASVAIPTLMAGIWWADLTDLAISHEEKEWMLGHDGGMMIAPLFAALVTVAFWLVALLVLLLRFAIALRRARGVG